MFVSVEQVHIGVNNFIEQEIAKKSVGANKFLVYFAMPIIDKQITNYINSFASNPLTKELFDSNNNVDLNAIYNMAKSAIQKSGQFTMFGIIFNETDVDKLYNFIKGINV